MATMLEGLLHLQAIERELVQVRRQLRTRKSAVANQEKQIQVHQEDWDALQAKVRERHMAADQLELDLKDREAHVSKLRSFLNQAKTNKEYAAILTEINTFKADSANIEDNALRALQEIDAVKAQADDVLELIRRDQERLEQIHSTSSGEISRLNGMLEELSAKRASAAKAVPSKSLELFERIAENYDGEGMAVIEVHGHKPPHSYVCGGCFMGLNAEHANVLRVRDEIRTCDNCGRILYLEAQAERSQTP